MRPVWRCPGDRFCGDLVSVAWAPDGHRLALSLTEFGGRSLYAGLHVIDTDTGRDVQIPGASESAATTAAALQALVSRSVRALGCATPGELAWSPDGKRIAYQCADFETGSGDRIYVINADGSHRIRLATGTESADWPSWSPDGTRIAFSTEVQDRRAFTPPGVDEIPAHRCTRSGLEGSRRTLVARAGVAPVWSPDGKTIAYRGRCGYIRLVTPLGKDVTPGSSATPCPGIRPAGWPVGSPDGTLLAIGTSHGIYTVEPDGSRLTRLTAKVHVAAWGEIRPVWQPLFRIRQPG